MGQTGAGRVIFLRLGLATGVLYLVLIQPNHPAALSWGALGVFPLELPVILAALLVLGAGRAGGALRVGLVVALVAIAILKLADFGTFIAFNRGFNLVADYNLLPAAWDLTRGSIGLLAAVLAVVGGGVLVVLLGGALWWATGVFARLDLATLPRATAAVLFVPALALAVAEIGQARRAWSLPPALRAAIPGRRSRRAWVWNGWSKSEPHAPIWPVSDWRPNKTACATPPRISTGWASAIW